MSEPVSFDKPDPAQDLARARASVLAILAGSGGSIQAVSLQAPGPLRPLPPALEAKLADRAIAGVDPLGTAHPRGRVWQRVVLPSSLFAGLDALGFGVAVADNHPVLAIGAGVLFVPFAAAAIGGARFAGSDPLRLSTRERRAITTASRWHSSQTWTGPVSFSQERALVVAATRAVERITRCPAWRGGRLDEHRVRLDLASELDQIDTQAVRIAQARYEGSSGGLPTPRPVSPAVDAAWETAVTRVAALTCYADSLDGMSVREATAIARLGDPVRDSALLAGSVQDEIAVEDLTALMFFLSAGAGRDSLGG